LLLAASAQTPFVQSFLYLASSFAITSNALKRKGIETRKAGARRLGAPRVVSTYALMIGRCSLQAPWMGSVISASSGGEQTQRLGLFRKPRRITITVSQLTAELLVQRSLREGRSLSNLAAVLLERAIKAEQANQPALDWTPSRLLSHSQDEVHG
jgi:hypothetical protein